LDAVNEEAESFLALLRDDRLFRTFIRTPGIAPKRKMEVLDRVFKGKLTPTFLDFLELILAKRRQLHVEDILEEFCDLYDEARGRVRVEAVTALPLEPDSQAQLSSVLAEKLKKTILLENSVEPKILGGLILRYGDLVADGSVLTRLKNVASSLRTKKLGSELVHENQS
jgi:F-type H+-transporting ATPase subunit delta